ncbi:MAG: AraC family transcriptional regulator [Bacteroidetes bacterium]|nr:MAG: AraC family transcriptional regulator [Bacteroidota bacterium]
MQQSPFLFLIIAIAFTQAMVFSVIVFFRPLPNHSNRLLSAFLFISASGMIPWIFKLSGIISTFPRLLHAPVGFFFLIVPIFYLYALSVANQLKRKHLSHLLPGLFEFLFLFIIFLLPDDARFRFYNVAGKEFLGILYTFIWPCYSIFYALLSIRLVNGYGKIVPVFYTNLNGKLLKWIKVTGFILIVYFLIEFLAAYFVVFESNRSIAIYVSALTNLIWIYWVSICGLLQKEIVLPINDYKELLLNNTPVNNNLTAQESTLALPLDNTDEPKQENQLNNAIDLKNYQLVCDLFIEKHVYLNKDISLFIVAEMTELHIKDVSRLINQYAKKNFNQFVNSFRVEEAKKHLINSELNHLNLTGIAEKVGFNSRSTFFSAFKQLEGVTPNEFKKLSDNQLNNKSTKKNSV